MHWAPRLQQAGRVDAWRVCGTATQCRCANAAAAESHQSCTASKEYERVLQKEGAVQNRVQGSTRFVAAEEGAEAATDEGGRGAAEEVPPGGAPAALVAGVDALTSSKAYYGR